MKYIGLDIIKNHLNIDADYTQDDDYLKMLWDVCLNVIDRHIDHSIDELALTNGNELPGALKQAALLLLGSYYANREHIAYTSTVEIPHSFSYLISLYQDYAGRTTTKPDYYGEVMDEIEDLHYSMTNLAQATDSLLNTTENLSERAEVLENKTIEGESPVNVCVDGNKTTVSIDDVNLGEY